MDADSLYPVVLGFDLSTRITVNLTQASISEDYHIEGISDDWSAAKPNSWQTAWQLSNATDLTYPERLSVNLKTNGDGDTTTLDTVGGTTDHWEAVKEAEDSKTAGQTLGAGADLYTVEDLALTDIKPLRILVHARWVATYASGDHSKGRIILKIAGSTYYSESITLPTSGYEVESFAFDAAGITIDNIDDMQIGVELTVYNFNITTVDQVYAEVEYLEW